MKSAIIFLIGIFTGISAAYMLGSAAMQYALLKTVDPPPSIEAKGPSSRYQIVFSPHVRADTYMLDTFTGTTWRLVKYTDAEGEPEIWAPADWAKTKADLWSLITQYGIKKEKTKKTGN